MSKESKHKKLLFISHDGDFKGGAEISGLELLKSAKKRGYAISAIVPKKSEFYVQLEKQGITVKNLDYSWFLPPNTPPESIKDSDNLHTALTLARIIKEEGVDCVISNSTVVPWGALAAAIADTPHIWVCREFPQDDLAYISDYYDFVNSFSNKILANSQNVAQYLKTTFNLSQVGHFYSYVDTTTLRLGKKNTERRIVQVGNIALRKNQLELILAAGMLNKKANIRCQLVFIGHIVEREYYELLKNKISELGLVNFVSFVPFTTKPWELIYENDIFVQTSSSESIGRTTTEAMKLGLICIGSDIPGVKEAFDLGGGHLYKHGDPEDLYRQLKEILSNIIKYKKVAEHSQTRALDNMSESACHDPFFKHLKSVLDTPNPMRELRHLYPYSLAELQRNEMLNLDIAKEAKKSSDLMAERAMLYKTLDDIYGSRIWKLMNKIRKNLIQHK